MLNRRLGHHAVSGSSGSSGKRDKSSAALVGSCSASRLSQCGSDRLAGATGSAGESPSAGDWLCEAGASLGRDVALWWISRRVRACRPSFWRVLPRLPPPLPLKAGRKRASEQPQPSCPVNGYSPTSTPMCAGMLLSFLASPNGRAWLTTVGGAVGAAVPLSKLGNKKAALPTCLAAFYSLVVGPCPTALHPCAADRLPGLLRSGRQAAPAAVCPGAQADAHR